MCPCPSVQLPLCLPSAYCKCIIFARDLLLKIDARTKRQAGRRVSKVTGSRTGRVSLPARGRILWLPALPGPSQPPPCCRGLSPGLAGREASSSHIYISSACSSKEHLPGTCLPRALGTGPGRCCNREGLAGPALPPQARGPAGLPPRPPGPSGTGLPPSAESQIDTAMLPHQGNPRAAGRLGELLHSFRFDFSSENPVRVLGEVHGVGPGSGHSPRSTHERTLAISRL